MAASRHRARPLFLRRVTWRKAMGRRHVDDILMRRLVTRGIFALFFNAAVLFLPAGTFAWPMGWAYLGLQAVTIGYALFGIRDEALFEERARWHKDAKWWDKWLMPLAVLPMVCLPAVAGFDVRFAWSPDPPPWLNLAGLVLAAAGQALILWAIKVNTFFSSVVRIQTDRGHRVVTDGPYKLVRHPGYTGFIMSMVAYPLMLGSLWALVPAAVGILVIVVRTGLEDRTLQVELPAYASFTETTPNRLIPGIW